MRAGWAGCVVAVLLILSGCATVEPGRRVGDGEMGWWTVRVLMDWPPEAEPSWHLDPLVAHRVVAPVLERYRSGVALWRFHRRAARDQAGHQFSFLFYASPATAGRVYRAIGESALLAELKASGRIRGVGYDDTSRVERPGVGDTSDARWPGPVKRSWPHFIMGVSAMWLDLIDALAREEPVPAGGDSLEETVERYRKINASLDALWEKEGGHALLHHLNAVFGYGPVALPGNKRMRF